MINAPLSCPEACCRGVAVANPLTDDAASAAYGDQPHEASGTLEMADIDMLEYVQLRGAILNVGYGSR